MVDSLPMDSQVLPVLQAADPSVPPAAFSEVVVAISARLQPIPGLTAITDPSIRTPEWGDLTWLRRGRDG